MRQALTPKDYFVKFYARRSLRILPVTTPICLRSPVERRLAIAAGAGQETLRQVVGQSAYAFTYTYDFFHASQAFTHSPLLTHFWSLAVEEQFYLVASSYSLCGGPRSSTSC